MLIEKKKSSSFLKNGIHCLVRILNVFLLVLALCILLPRVFGMRPFVVLSGSMEPNYQVGSIVYAQKTDPKLVEVGDPITYVLNEDLVIVTHRVVDVDQQEEFFVTKGDANETIDAQKVHFKNLLGVVKFSIPYLGYLFVRLQNKYFLIAFLAFYFIVILFEKMLEENEDE